MIKIDGAFGEGGGQILRTSLTLSALTGKPIQLHHIRNNRNQPGLRPQHLAAVSAIAKLTDAELSGAHLDSAELTLKPSTLRSGRFRFEISTAGALTLVLQTIFIPLSFAGSTSMVTLTGGTHVPWSPIYHYLEWAWLPAITSIGFRAELRLLKGGFYPRGGGQSHVKILPARTLIPFTCVNRGVLLRIRGLSVVAGLKDEISKRQKHQALQRLYPICADTKINTSHMPALGKGTFILLRADFSNGGCACYAALGAPGKPAELVADEAVDQLLTFLETDGCVDRFLADQLLLPLIAVNGRSVFRTSNITPHLLTNTYVIEQFFPGRVRIEGDPNAPGLVTVRGGAIRA